jgi:predicted RNA-binding protein YlqC (UPF0109 family)
MEEVLKTIIEGLVENKEAISIEKGEKDGKEVYSVKVDSKEMGKVIGRQGKIAQSIRTVIRALGAKEQKKVDVEFLD